MTAGALPAGEQLRGTKAGATMAGERLIAWVRVAIAPSMLLLLLLSDTSHRPYPVLAWAINVYAVVYSAVSFYVGHRVAARTATEPASLAWTLTIADAGVILAVSAVTGAADSRYVPILLLVVISVALRFNLRRALVVAGGIGVILAVIILAVPRPALPMSERVPAAIWWAWLCIFAAILAGSLSQIAEEAMAGRGRAEAEAKAEHRRLEQERKLRQRLEALEQARRDFLHAVAHDFRTPITSLEGLARVLVQQPDLDEEQRRHALQLIESHAHHVSALLVSVREVALTESLGPDRALQLSDVFFSELVRVATAAVGLAPERINVFIEHDLAVIRTDADKTQRILTNLLENAARHSPLDSPIDVRLMRREGMVDLTVLDRGPGLPDEVAGRAFDKFFGFGERRGSSGLGMWIVAQLAEALGGSVEASPREGGGLVVRVTQPLIEPTRRSAATRA